MGMKWEQELGRIRKRAGGEKGPWVTDYTCAERHCAPCQGGSATRNVQRRGSVPNKMCMRTVIRGIPQGKHSAWIGSLSHIRGAANSMERLTKLAPQTRPHPLAHVLYLRSTGYKWAEGLNTNVYTPYLEKHNLITKCMQMFIVLNTCISMLLPKR